MKWSNPCGGANFDPGVFIWTTLVEVHQIMLQTKVLGLVVLEKIFFKKSLIQSISEALRPWCAMDNSFAPFEQLLHLYKSCIPGNFHWIVPVESEMSFESTVDDGRTTDKHRSQKLTRALLAQVSWKKDWKAKNNVFLRNTLGYI